MLRLLRSLVFWAPDEGAAGGGEISPPSSAAAGDVGQGAGELSPTSPAEAAGGAKTAEADVGGKPAEGKADAGKLDEPTVSLSKDQSREIARLKGVLAQRQSEIARLKAGPEGGKVDSPPEGGSRAVGGQKKADADVHPALADAEWSADGKSVIVDGHEVPPSMVVRQYELEQSIGELKGARQQDDVSRAQGALESAYGEFDKTVSAVVTEVAKDVFSSYKGEDAKAAEDWLAEIVDGVLSQKIGEGAELSDELVVDSIRESLARVRTLSALGAKYQQAGNEEHRETNKVKPDGAPGMPAAVNPLTLTGRAAEEHARQAAKLARQATGGA